MKVQEGKELAVLGKQDLTESYTESKGELPKYWRVDYVRGCIEAIPNYQHKMLAQFLWMTGCRITEALSLKKGQIDFKDYVVLIRWLKSRKFHERRIPLHPVLKDLLQLYVANMRVDDRVFPISRVRAWQLMRKYFKGHPHQLRHSFAVNWLLGGGDLYLLSRMLGHKRIQTTSVYLQIVPMDVGKELIKIQF